MSSLKSKTIKGIFWSLAERAGLQITSLISSIILARLLTPSEFGIVGIVLAIVSFFRLFIDFGLRDALIRKIDASESDYSAVFLFNILVSGFIYALLFIFSDSIAVFYNEPRLAEITKVLGLNIIVVAGSFIQSTRFTKRIDFKSQFIAGIASSVIGLGTGVYLALNGYGVWAIVWQNLVSNLVTTLLFWILDPWLPNLNFKLKEVRSLLHFGSNLFLSGLINSAYNSLYSLLIGKYNSSKDLGLYTKARSLTEQQIATICSAVQKVSYPVFSDIQDDQVRLRQGYQKVIESLMFVVIPISVIGVVFAKPIIQIALTEKWNELIPYFQIFCLTGLLYPFHTINLNIIKVKGRSGLFLKLEVAKFLVSVIIFLATFRFGLMAIVVGQLIASAINLFLNSFFSGQLIDYPLIHQFRDIGKLLFSGVLLLGTCYVLINTIVISGFAMLVVDLSLALTAHFLFCLALRINALQEFVVFLNKRVSK